MLANVGKSIAWVRSGLSVSRARVFSASTARRADDGNARFTPRFRSKVTEELWRGRLAATSADESHAVPLFQAPGVPRNVREHRVVEKRMSDSMHETDLCFGTDPVLRDEYMNLVGAIRFGKILEDLDAFAGNIAFKHCDDGDPQTSPLTLVTASVDKIELLSQTHRVRADVDYRLSGHVTWVGNSSMEITVWMRSLTLPTAVESSSAFPIGETTLTAKFTFVARDAQNEKAAKVNRLIVSTPEEKALFEQGEKNTRERREQVSNGLERMAPSETERLVIHALYMEQKKAQQAATNAGGAPCVYMKDTTMSSTRLCQPQDRNVHNKIFGGYLMKEAYELAWANGAMFSQDTPRLLCIDDIAFRRPVAIGSILSLTSQVVFSPGHQSLDYDPKAFQVSVLADVLDPETGQKHTTNCFNITFLAPNKPLRRVLPRSYGQFLRTIEAMRRAKGVAHL